jgi:hypothetical protein
LDKVRPQLFYNQLYGIIPRRGCREFYHVSSRCGLYCGRSFFIPQNQQPMLAQAQNPTVLVIDPDVHTSNGLAALLLDRRERPDVMTATSVQVAEHALQTEYIAWLFIRISLWDDFQRTAAGLPQPPDRIVFLSPAHENYTGDLPELLDAHLKPPYSAAKIARIWDRLTHPSFRPRPLDFFFLKTDGHYHIIRYQDLRQVRRHRGKIQIFTRIGDFEVIGSLVDFQARLPVPLTRVGRNWLVNHSYTG